VDAPNPTTMQGTSQFRCKVAPTNLSNAALAKEVDVFYDNNPANLKLPIRTAMIYVLMKVSGVAEKDLEKYRTNMIEALK
jgi:hypothetical protein